MKRFFVLICSAALVCSAQGETKHEKETSHKKKPPGAPGHHEPPPPAKPGRGPGGGTVVKPGEPGTHPETPPGDNAAAKPAPSAPVAPVYHYNFPTKSGMIGRDFSRPLTAEEQSKIAGEIENGQLEGTHGGTAAYDSENGSYHYNFRTKSGMIGRDFTRPLTTEEQSTIARQIENGQSEGTQVQPGVAPTQKKVIPFRPQQFNLLSKPDPQIAGAKFEGTGHIPGSEACAG